MKILNTLTPYKVIDYNGIQYGVCRDFDHISRYRGLRQVVHNPTQTDRFIALENTNEFQTQLKVVYYEVKPDEENRLDLIAHRQLGNASYAWIIAYFNDIQDGFSVHAGDRVKLPNAISDLFNKGELLASINPTMLNLGEE